MTHVTLLMHTPVEADSMSYDARTLVTFKVFSNLAGTVWTKASLWKMMGTLLLIALTVATCIAVSWFESSSMRVRKARLNHSQDPWQLWPSGDGEGSCQAQCGEIPAHQQFLGSCRGPASRFLPVQFYAKALN